MPKHLLLHNAFEFNLKDSVALISDYRFDNLKGYWERDNFAMVLDKRFPKPSTKKEDVETGEDMKGH